MQYRRTKQRQAMLEAIEHHGGHLTAERIYTLVKRQFPRLSLGTVYRNLQKLVADQKLQILMRGRSQHFDPLVERHQHFICETCDRVYDVLVDNQKEIKPFKLPHEGFKVTSHQLAFYGTCKHCSS